LPLPTIAGATRYNSYANVVNNSGTTIGWVDAINASGSTVGRRLLRWDVGASTPVDLGPGGILGNPQSTTAINSAGVIGGNVKFGQNLAPARWDANAVVPTQLQDLGTITGSVFSVTALDEQGNAVGYAHKLANGRDVGKFALKWLAGTTQAIELQRLDTFTNSSYGDEAHAINASGFIVGWSLTTARLWNPAGSATDLSTLIPAGSGWTRLNSATDISDTGWIAGTGQFDPDGSGPLTAYTRHYSLLVPQAGTYGLGDTNCDTKIDFADLVILAQKYDLTNPTQATDVADFDLNGVTDFNDLVVLAQNYGAASANIDGLGSDTFAADWALAQSFLPEPTTLTSLVGVASLALRRRR
jgi:hypothetical protein